MLESGSGAAFGLVKGLFALLALRSRRSGDQVARSPADPAPQVDAQPAVSRLHADSKPTSGHPRLGLFPPRELANRHARLFFERFLDPDQFTPGSVYTPGEMYLEYSMMCDELGVLERPWNSFAGALNKMLGGGRTLKPYHRMEPVKGRDKQSRVYVVPDWDSPVRKAHERPKKQPKNRRSSASNRLQVGAEPTPDRMTRAAA